jgi:hypothetical protein
MDEKVYESSVGPVIDVTGRSVLKAFFNSLVWIVPGSVLIFGGCWMMIEELAGSLKAGGSIEDTVYIGGGCVLVGWIMLSRMVRSVVAAASSKVYFRAGPRGVSICSPGGISFAKLMACYKLVTHEFTWDRVKRCYPAVVRTKGFTTQSDIVFEGKDDWEVRVTTLVLAGSIQDIAEAVSVASKRTDLLAGQPGAEESA